MFHFLVLGAGKMGIVLAKDLLDSHPQNKVTLVDISFEKLKHASKIIQSERLTPIQRNIEDKNQREEVFKGQNIALCALLHRHSLLALETALRIGVHFVDLVGEYTLERLEFDEEAKRMEITVLSGIGVSPGITNVCVGRAVHILDETDKTFIYVGGNPVQAKPPLNYRILYAVDSLLNFYEKEVTILKNGQVKKVSPLSGVESIQFPIPFSDMECFYTDGLHSLIYTMRGIIKDELAEKTVRHRGHVEGIETLKACGLFSREPICVGGQDVVPREILEAILDSKMRLGEEKDATLMRIVASGKKSGKPSTHIFEMVDCFDSQKNYTSMAKTTSFPASIAAQMIVSGKIAQRGVVFPESVFHAELFQPFMDGLKARGVVVSHKV